MKKLLCGIIWPVSLYKGSSGLTRFSMTVKSAETRRLLQKIFV
nr:MAG TPA: hypothetical protein [Caudoviricetes sp.]